MNWITSIFQMANQNWTSRIFTLILIALLTYSSIQIFAAKEKAKCQDCQPYVEQAKFVQDQNKQLMAALLHIQDMNNNPVRSSTYLITNEDFAMFASNDTTPKQRVINRYIDSIKKIMKKQDSIFKAKTTKHE